MCKQRDISTGVANSILPDLSTRHHLSERCGSQVTAVLADHRHKWQRIQFQVAIQTVFVADWASVASWLPERKSRISFQGIECCSYAAQSPARLSSTKWKATHRRTSATPAISRQVQHREHMDLKMCLKAWTLGPFIKAQCRIDMVSGCCIVG
jgi:hypothetical protein